MISVTDANFSVPQWFDRFYDSAYFWIAGYVGGVLIAVFVIVVCRLWFDTKEAHRFLQEKEEAERERRYDNE